MQWYPDAGSVVASTERILALGSAPAYRSHNLVRIIVYASIPSVAKRFRPFSFRSYRDARYTVPVGLLLQATAVGYDTHLACRIKVHIWKYPTGAITSTDSDTERDSNAWAVAGCAGNITGPPSRPESVHNPTQAGRIPVICGPVYCG